MSWYKEYRIYKGNNVSSKLCIEPEKELNLGINIGSEEERGRRYVWIKIFLPFISLVTFINWRA